MSGKCSIKKYKSQPFCVLSSLIDRTGVKEQLINLVKLAKKGDKPAFDEIIRLCVPDMSRIAMSILKNKDDADDAVCDTVVKAYENLHKLNDCKFFKTWIIRMLINRANDIYKRRSKIVYFHDITNELQSEDEYDFDDDELKEAIADLSLNYRTVITLHYYQDMKIKEIASALQIPQGTVKWRLSKAKTMLKEKLIVAPLPKRKEGVGKCNVT
ncbi:MAG: sigma-70 family RNA polymerase sigma factor [Oscillospiraceae bacterium]|jgi:RNA polymerase sigma-70 factor (ECF subfamily)|nr:sigma-70 family RNA polymerase sigma factor [Oscillospiraceae bacterium]